jgi:hypothetical protein
MVNRVFKLPALRSTEQKDYPSDRARHTGNR